MAAFEDAFGNGFIRPEPGGLVSMTFFVSYPVGKALAPKNF